MWGRMQTDMEEGPLQGVAVLGKLGDDCDPVNCAGGVACRMWREINGEGADGLCGYSALCEGSDMGVLHKQFWRCQGHNSMSC